MFSLSPVFGNRQVKYMGHGGEGIAKTTAEIQYILKVQPHLSTTKIPSKTEPMARKN